MATLQKIRSQAVLLLIVVGVALFAFIIGDFLTSGSSILRQSQETIADIDGSPLNYKEYDARILEMEEVYKMQTGQNNLQADIMHQIRESVFETIVRERLLDEQAEDLGVSVTAKELYDMVNGQNVHYMVQQMPFFQNPETKRFDRSMMMNFLRTIQQEDFSMYSAEAQEQIKQMKNYWLFWENNLKYVRLDEKMANLITKAVGANSLDAKDEFEAARRSVDFEYASKSYASMPDSIFKVSLKELSRRYEEQKERFKQEPYRSAAYVVVDILPSQEDNEAIKARIEKTATEFSTEDNIAATVNSESDIPYMDCYIANSQFSGNLKDFVQQAAVGEVKGPYFEDNAWIMLRMVDKINRADSVKARQIFISNTNDRKASEQLTDSLLNVLRKGEDFAVLAGQYSQDQTANDGGEMGWFREIDAYSGIGPEFAEACFTASKNQLLSVRSKFGWHIVQVLDKTNAVEKSKVAQLYLSVTPSSKTYSAEYNKLNKLLADNPKAEDFLAAAREAGLQVSNAAVVKSSDNTIGNVPDMRQAVRFVYNNKLGAVSTVLENSNNQFMVIAVTGVHDNDYLTLDQVRDELSREIINEKKSVSIIASLQMNENTGLSELAKANAMQTDTVRLVNFSMRRITGLGEEPALLAAVMNAAKGELSKPLAGKNAVYVFRVIGQVEPETEFDATAEKINLDMNSNYRLAYQAYEALRAAKEVEDNRIRFY